ncbi:hypothetical protein GCM10020220_007800 [Nonomuraea rubra]
MLQQSSSRTLPDVLMLDNPDVQQIAESGALSPLSDYGVTGEGMVPAVVQAGTYAGSCTGSPPREHAEHLLQPGPVPAGRHHDPPRTWDELRAARQEADRARPATASR